MNARCNVLKQLKLRGMVAGSAIIDYNKGADVMSAEQYVEEVVAGKRFDTNLSKQLHKGFRAEYLMPGYLYHDWDCQGYGVLIVWDNPDYSPPQVKLARRGVTPPYYRIKRNEKPRPSAFR